MQTATHRAPKPQTAARSARQATELLSRRHGSKGYDYPMYLESGKDSLRSREHRSNTGVPRVMGDGPVVSQAHHPEAGRTTIAMSPVLSQQNADIEVVLQLIRAWSGTCHARQAQVQLVTSITSALKGYVHHSTLSKLCCVWRSHTIPSLGRPAWAWTWSG